MAHGRQQVRDALVEALTGLPTTQGRVYSGRVYPHDRLPSLAVFLERETTDETDHRTRTAFYVVEARVSAGSSTDTNGIHTAVDDAVDQITAEVETAIGSDDTYGGVALATFPPETEIDLSGEGEKPVAVARMVFPVLYRIEFGTPESIIN